MISRDPPRATEQNRRLVLFSYVFEEVGEEREGRGGPLPDELTKSFDEEKLKESFPHKIRHCLDTSEHNSCKKGWTKPPLCGILKLLHKQNNTQKGRPRYMNLSTYDSSLQVVTSPAGEVVTLQDDRFPWTERKVKTVKLAKLYDKAGYPEYSLRAATCSTWLQYGVSADGSKQLSAANFCQLRLCPLCIARRAKRAAYKLSQVLDQVEREHGAMFLFLTLTMKNVSGSQLGDALGQLNQGWNRLTQHRHVKAACKGWFRALEITRNGQEYHPHIHAILAVPPEYFRRNQDLYIRQEEWIDRWKLALRVDYRPSVRIQTAKAKGEFAGGRAAAVEAAKYAVKDSDYIDDNLPQEEAIGILRDYTEALYKRRLTAYGGWLREAAKDLDADDLDDGDLVHVDDDGIREDVAELIETYNWHFGSGDYILSRREINPLKLQRNRDK